MVLYTGARFDAARLAGLHLLGAKEQAATTCMGPLGKC